MLFPIPTPFTSPCSTFSSSEKNLELGSRQRVTSAGDLVVKERGQEVGIVLAGDLGSEVLSSKLELVALGSLGGELVGLLLEELEGVALVDALALGGGDAVLDPLPELGAGHLGGGGILPVVIVSICTDIKGEGDSKIRT